MRLLIPLVLTGGMVAAPCGALAGWGYRKTITIDGAQVVGGPHADFPVLVSLVDPDLRTVANGGQVASASGYDLQFRAVDGITLLDHEIEVFDPGTGRLAAWVRLPGTAGPPDTRVQNGVSPVFYLYYGNDAVRAPRNNPRRVWLANYRYVYHFNQTSGALVNSTYNGITASENPAATIVKGEVASPLNGHGWDLVTPPPVPAESFVDITDFGLIGGFTIEGWFWFDTLPAAFVGLVTKGRESGTDWVGLYLSDDQRTMLGWAPGGGNVLGTTTLVTGRWYYMAVSFNGGTARNVYLYDALETSDPTATTFPLIPQNARVGDDSTGVRLDGRVDEVRFSYGARAPGWVATQARNQSCPSTSVPWGCAAGSQPITVPFLALGAEQALPSSAGVFVNDTVGTGLALGGRKDGGVAWGDYDGNRCLDVIVNRGDTTGAPSDSRLYWQPSQPNCTATFTDVTSCLAPGLLATSAAWRSVVWGDLDNDGHPDFARSAQDRIEVYLSNGPGGTSGAGCPPGGVPWTRFGAAGSPSQTIDLGGALASEGLAFVDYDADGDLDLYFNDDSAGSRALVIWTNDGSGTFSAAAVPGLPVGTTGDVDYATVGDVDVDGDVDVLSRTAGEVDLWVNQGGSFTAGDIDLVADNANKGGVAFCDLDNDGDFDAVWTDAPADQTQVFRQDPIGTFTPVPGALPAAGREFDGVACGDFDHDGDVDVVLTDTGRDYLMLNDGGFAFSDGTPAPVASFAAAGGEGVAAGDYDHDGDLDLLISQGGGSVAADTELWRNETDDRNYLMVRARHRSGVPTRDAVGATATLWSCSGTLVAGVRDVNGGKGHGSQDAAPAHFGLPTSGAPRGPDAVYEVRVRFVGGVEVRRAVIPGALGSYQEVTITNTDANNLAACAATAVELQSFEARAGDGSVELEWTTGSELDNLGFHLHRGPSDEGPWTRLTPTLIPGLGSSPLGQTYSWRDSGLSNGERYHYLLEDVDTASRSTLHGPVSAVPTSAPGGDDGTGTEEPVGDDGPSGSPPGPCPSWVLSAHAQATASPGPASAEATCTAHGEPERVSFAVRPQGSRGVEVELETGGFYAVREASGGVRVYVPGLVDPREPTAAALPLKRALVPAVVGRKVRIASFESLGEAAFPGLRPAAVGAAEVVALMDGTLRPARRTVGLRPGSRGHVPAGQARLADVVFQGQDKRAVLELHPLRYDAGRRRLVLSRRLRLRLAFTGRDAEERGFRRAGRERRRRWRTHRGALVHLYTSGPGLYGVRFEEVFPDLRCRRPMRVTRLRLQRDGAAVPFHVEPSNGLFGPGSVLYFYTARGVPSTAYSSEAAYELVRAPGERMRVAPAPPRGPVVLSASTTTVPFETNRLYVPGLLDAEDVWLWEGVTSGDSRAVDFTLSGLDLSSGEPARVEVSLQGGSDTEGTLDHHVRVLVNGAVAGETAFDGKLPHTASLSIPVSVLSDADNELTVANLDDGAQASYVFLDRFSVTYPQGPAMRGGTFEGTWPRTGAVEVTGVREPTLIVEITGAGAAAGPRVAWVTGHEAAPGAVRFQARAGHRYLVVGSEGLRRPRTEGPTPSRLRDRRNQADYVLIAPEAFLDAARPLLERREAQGLTTRAVTIEEIASAFGHGNASGEAMKEFVSYAFHVWRHPSPRYVLLLGDSSSDPRNFTGTSLGAPLPALWARTSYLWTVSDPELGAVNGEDRFPDVAVGRLPARDADEATLLVQKLLDWEDSFGTLGGQAALVADDGGDFEADVEDLAARFLAGRNPRMILLRELGAGTRASILDAMNGGLSLLSYVGHGGTTVWAGENVLNSWDPPSLLAQSRQPLMLTMSCLNGYFVAPSFDSLAEAFMKVEGRGSIAAFTPTGLSLDWPAHVYHRAVMAELTSGRHARLGDAILAAQKAYAQSGVMPELLTVYHLLGDPAMTLR